MTNKEFIPALTGIRAVCVYFIFFKHLNFFSPQLHPNLYLFVNQFYCFLNYFFVLSGFLIYYKYNEISSLNKWKLYNYFVNRISRVFPILILLISITFFLSYYHGYISAKETIKLYLLNITLLKGFSSTYLLTGIGPSWSMSVEELFYLLSPFIFLYAKNLSSLIRIILFFYATGLLITFLFSLHPFEGFFSSYIFTAYATFFGRIFEFACGIFLGMIVKGNFKSNFFKIPAKRMFSLGLLIIAASMFLLYSIALHYNVMQAIDIWPGVLVNNIMLPVGITFLFYSLVYYDSLLQRFLGSRIMTQLGNSTYSFYLLHTTFVLSYIFKFISTNVFIAFITMVIISFIFHKIVEQPLATFFRNKLYRKRT
jgi:peptidoglycan/LPS O-acetylase OafA/YrhL